MQRTPSPRRPPQLLAPASLLVLAALLLLLPLCARADNMMHPITLEIKAGQAQCFYEHVRKDAKVTFVFEVSAGPDFSIKASMRDPLGREVYMKEEASDDIFSYVTVDEGEHEFCLSNEMSTFSSKEVNFNIYVDGEGIGKTHMANKASSEFPTVLTQVETSLVGLDTEVDSLTTMMDNFSLRLHRHFYLAETIASRVHYWALVQSVMIVAVALWQVSTVKQYFNTSRYK